VSIQSSNEESSSDFSFLDTKPKEKDKKLKYDEARYDIGKRNE